MAEEMYRQLVLDRFHQPQYRGDLSEAAVRIEYDNPLCGDRVSMSIELDNDVITAATWEGEGCAISQVAADMLAEQLVGKTIAQAQQISDAEMLAWLGIEVTPARQKCALLALSCIQGARGQRSGIRGQE